MPRRPGAHVCVPSSARAEQLAVAAAWIREGIARSERCLYLAEHPDDPQLRAALDPMGATHPDTLAILGATEIDAGSEPLVPAHALAWLRAMVERAVRAGWRGVRVCQEVRATPTDGHVVEYECELDDLVREQPLVLMCIYDRSRIPAAVIRESFAVHPYVWVRDAMCANPRYVPPEHYRAPDRPTGEVSNILDQLYRDEISQQRRRDWLRATLAEIENERRKVSRTLHDELGQALVVVTLQGRNETIDDAIEIVRAMARELRPMALDDLGLVAAVRSLATREATRAGLNLQLDLSANEAKLDSEVATTCYRIIESALANVVAHARATTVMVALRDIPGGIEVVVRDDGVGFASDPRAGLGLIDMEERTNLVGGLLEIRSGPGEGTTVTVHVPT